MKSLVTLVNTTSSTISIAGEKFDPGVPVVVYRSGKYFKNAELFGKFLYHINLGELVGYTLDGSVLTAVEAIEIANYLHERMNVSEPSYSEQYALILGACHDLLDGVKRQMDEFNWTDPEVLVSRRDACLKALNVFALLSCGLLSDAKTELDQTTPDGDSEFFNAARMAQFSALFASALS